MSTIKYSTLPNPLWQFTDYAGKFLIDGYVNTWEDLARTTPKAVAQDPDGSEFWPNPFELSSSGSQFDLFWADDSNYFIEVFNNEDVLLYSFTVYSATATSTGAADEKNYIVNGQFTFADNQKINSIASGDTILGPGWVFNKNNTSATDYIQFVPFGLGQNVVDGNPYQYFQYVCTSPGVSETTKTLTQKFSGVQSFEGRTLTFQIDAVSSTLSQISVSIIQNFGSGGSSTVTTQFTGSPFTLTSSFSTINAQVEVPSTSGKVRGTAGDDYVAIVIGFPINASCSIGLVNGMLMIGAINADYAYETYELDISRSYTSQYPMPQQETIANLSQGINDIYRAVVYAGYSTFSYLDLLPVGTTIEVPFSYLTIPENDPLFPAGFLYSDARAMDSYTNNYKHRRLANYVSPAIYGYGADGISNNSNVAGTVQFTNQVAGAVTAWADVSTGFTFSTITPGSPGVKQVNQIVCTAASALTAGTYANIYGTASQWYIWILKDGEGEDPLVAGKTGIPIPVTTGMTATQVGNLVASQIKVVRYNLPPRNSGLMPRGGPSADFQWDPDAATRYSIIDPYPVVGNIVGSLQDFQNATHTHTIPNPDGIMGTTANITTGFSGTTPGQTTVAVPGVTAASGGLQSNPNNILVSYLIKY